MAKSRITGQYCAEETDKSSGKGLERKKDFVLFISFSLESRHIYEEKGSQGIEMGGVMVVVLSMMV